MSKTAMMADVRRRRIGICGFPPPLRQDLDRTLEELGCLSAHLDGTLQGFGKTLDHYDALLVHANERIHPACLTELLETPKPWLFIGPQDVVLRNHTMHLRADDVLFEPFTPEDLQFRLHRAIVRKASVTQHTASHRSSIFIADDDPNVVILLSSVLGSHGWECHSANNGIETLSQIRSLLPDLLVLDIEMPGLNGFEVLRNIREDPGVKNIKILLLTASCDPAAVEKGSTLGADEYLGKPFNPLRAAGRIKHMLELAPPPRPTSGAFIWVGGSYAGGGKYVGKPESPATGSPDLA
jgi:two-component system alkaline phosphatase synthesis response regulator PhoP